MQNHSSKFGDDLFGEPIHVTKFCTKCRQTKPIDDFSSAASRKERFRRHTTCKACKAAISTAWFKKNSERHTKSQRSRTLRRYGLDSASYAEMFAAQNGQCAICGTSKMQVDYRNGKPKPMFIDHNHVTGRVRALLCSQCNTGLGLFRDDPKLLRAAIAYIEKHDME